MRMCFVRLAFAVLLSANSIVAAQWPETPEENLVISSASGEQAITKIVALEDGGCYISWFDNQGGGYDVYIQRLDAQGNPMWQPNGIMIADRNYSSVMDFALDLDPLGNAIVAFRQNMIGGDGVVVSSISLEGEIQWNSIVQNPGSFVASPVIATTNMHIVVGWICDDDSKFQQLNLNGMQSWKEPLVISDSNGGSLQVSDIHPSLDGGVIASFVQYTTFWGTKLLYAQRIDAQGNTVWSELVQVMLNNSLQMGAYPDFISDGDGGGFFSWYGVGPLQCYATRILGDGSMWFSGQVQVASSLGSTQRVNPIAVRDGGDFVVFFRPQDNNQSSDGIGGQRLSAFGELLWGDSGIIIKQTTSSPQYGSFATALTDIGAMLSFTESSSFGNDVINAVSLDSSGATTFSTTFVSVASTPSSKSRTAAASTTDGVLFAWQDDRNGSNDIYAQRVNADGSLGNIVGCPGDINADGIVGVNDVLLIISMWGSCPSVGLCDADINGDDVVDVVDLLFIINVWGPCQ